MRVTVILRDLTDAFYEGIEGSFQGFNSRNDAAKFDYLKKDPQRFPMKIGSGQFRDSVELNQIIRGPHSLAFALLPRKGYKIAEFHITKA